MEMLSSKQKIGIIIACVIVVGIFIYYMTAKTKDNDYSILNEVVEDKTKEVESDTKEEQEEIVIHITGAVKNEGIVKLKEGVRIADAIEAAGGLTEEAELKNVNLAYLLKDGQKIYIPKITDVEEETEISTENGNNVIKDIVGQESSNGKININTATAPQLESLSGIGAGTAAKIIDYRETNGKFKTIEDIKNVSGIGAAKFDNIKDDICVK